MEKPLEIEKGEEIWGENVAIKATHASITTILKHFG
jgi:hypothetical protein